MKNKTLYAILGIGAAYLIWKYLQKNKMLPTTIVSPGFPATPIAVTNPIAQQSDVRVLEHGTDDLYSQQTQSMPSSYQTYYGTINGSTKKVPVLC